MNTDEYLFQQELLHEQMEDFYEKHRCGRCDYGYFECGDVEDERGICMKYSKIRVRSGYPVVDSFAWVGSDDYIEGCWCD